ncbi:MAG: type II toxin-antitoxin system VapC family toxin [Actinomycetota bacterium]
MLDTSAYSRLRGADESTIAHLAAAETVLVPTVVIGELEAGFRLGSRTADNQTRLKEFLGEPFVVTLPVTHDVASRYGELFAELRLAGTPVPVNDIWIAATTIDAGAHLITFDHDFERFGSLSVTVLG